MEPKPKIRLRRGSISDPDAHPFFPGDVVTYVGGLSLFRARYLREDYRTSGVVVWCRQMPYRGGRLQWMVRVRWPKATEQGCQHGRIGCSDEGNYLARNLILAGEHFPTWPQDDWRRDQSLRAENV